MNKKPEINKRSHIHKHSEDDWQDLHDARQDMVLDNIVRFIKKYKIFIILAVLFITGISGVSAYYYTHRTDRAVKLVEEYQVAHTNIGSQKYTNSLTSLSEIINDPELPDFYVYAATADLIRIYLGNRYLFNDLFSKDATVKENAVQIFDLMKKSIEEGVLKVNDNMSKEILVSVGELVNIYRKGFYLMFNFEEIVLPHMDKKYLPDFANELMMFMAIVQNNVETAKYFAKEILNSPRVDLYRKQRAEAVLLYLDEVE